MGKVSSKNNDVFKRARDIISGTEGKFAAGVSGGADSMCLLSLILEAGRGDDVTVLHIDHGLRDTSRRDRDLVAQFCQKNGVAFKDFCLDVAGGAKLSRRSIETEARLMRHDVFSRFCKREKVPVLLAHNRDDNLETVLMHIFRGCGIKGLVGMGEYDGHIIRPLLNVGKTEIYAFVKQQCVPYFEDETNTDTVYRRNFIRALIPKIEEGFAGVRDAVLSLSRIAAKTQAALEAQLDGGFFKKDGDAVLLSKRALDSPLAELYVISAVNQAGLSIDLEEKHIAAVIALKGLKSGKSLDLPHGLRVYSEGDWLAFEFSKPLMPPLSPSLPLSPLSPLSPSLSPSLSIMPTDSPNNNSFTRDAVEIQETDFCVGVNRIGGIDILIKDAEPLAVKGRIIVDSEAISGARLRFRRDCDRFFPCGGKPKKLKQYLNEKKIPNRKKDKLPLLCKDGEVLVIAGIQLSEKVKITPNTKKAYEITLNSEVGRERGKD